MRWPSRNTQSPPVFIGGGVGRQLPNHLGPWRRSESGRRCKPSTVEAAIDAQPAGRVDRDASAECVVQAAQEIVLANRRGGDVIKAAQRRMPLDDIAEDH